jgi:septum formation protein
MGEAGGPQLILASASRFRRRMLEAAGLTFRVEPAELDEARIRKELTGRNRATDAGTVAEVLARAKAEAVSARFPEAVVLAGDQTLSLDGVLLEKPVDIAAAREQLCSLRGKLHRLYTAAALAMEGRTVWTCLDRATLVMRNFTPDFLECYLARMGPRVREIVGAYEIDGPGIQLFERIEGDYFTIVGLPLLPLLAELRTRGVIGA